MSDEYQQDAGTPPAIDEQSPAPQSPVADAPIADAPAPAASEPAAPVKLFVRPINFELPREAVEDHFSAIGPLADVQMMRGYAFITFESPADATRAFDELNNSDLGGNALQIEFARERKEDNRGQFRVKVTRLPDGTAWQDFKDFVREKTEFSPLFAKVFRDEETGETIGALEFGSAEELEKSVALLNEAEYQDAVLAAEVDTSPFVPPRRGPSRGRGGFRGGRGGFRDDFRGGFRGGRGRGGFRDDRGRGGFRGGFRDDGFRGGRGRGGFRDDGFRGGRGGFRGGRGGYDRGDREGGYERDSYVRDRSPTRY